MSRPLSAFALLCFLCSSRAAAPPPRPEPLKGVIVSGRVLASEKPVDRVALSMASLDGKASEEPLYLEWAIEIPARWQIGHSALWVAGSRSGVGHLGPSADGPTRYALAEILRGRASLLPGLPDETGGMNFASFGGSATPLHDTRFLARLADGFAPRIHYDYLPAGPTSVRLCLLTNVEGQGVPGGKTDRLDSRLFARPGQKAAKWSFVSHSVRARWDAKGEEPGWRAGPWREEESFDVAFREPFQALGRGDDFYFLTASGNLFRAPPPAKGKHRKVVPVWDDGRARVVAFVTDADAGRTFLFLDAGPKGVGGPCVFEVADGVRLRHFDPALFRPGTEGPPALRRVVGYARVLQALGYVKDAPPPKKAKP